MTEAEKNEIVGLVMTEISSQAVDFDITTEQPQANDLLTAVREVAGRYVGVTLKWDDVARIATELANQAATRAEQAKTNVENMKTSVEQTVTDFNALAEEKKQEVQGVYQSDLNELKGDLGDKKDFIENISNDLFAIEKQLIKEIIDLRPTFRSGIFESSGYVFTDNNLRLTTQVFQPGVYNITAPEGIQFEIYSYNSDSSGTLKFNYRNSIVGFEFNNPFVITLQHLENPGSTPFTFDEIKYLRNELILQLDNRENKRTLINGIPTDVIVEFYLLDQSYTPYGVRALENTFRLKLKDSEGNVIVNGQDVNYKFYSDKIQKFVDVNTGEIVAYYILHYTGTDYGVDSNSLYFTEYAKSLTTNHLLHEYINRDENIVLIGDSIFGYHNLNILESFLSTMSNKKVYNCGFGGCTMAFRTPDGSGVYDNFSFVSLADAISENNYSSQIENMNVNQGYPYAVANLKKIDWSKPTTIFINYINNDITSNVSIGDMWNYTDTLEDFNKQSILGAFNYGLYKLLTIYPHIRVIQFTSAYRKLGNDSLPPYLYKNSIDLSVYDYDNAIKENASRLGLSVYDFHKFSGRNWLNTEYYQQDNSHYNANGFALLAKVINSLDNSFID